MPIFGLKAIAVPYNRYVHFNNDCILYLHILNMHDCMSCHIRTMLLRLHAAAC